MLNLWPEVMWLGTTIRTGRQAPPSVKGWPCSFSTDRLTWIDRRCPNGLQQQTVAPGSLVWRQPLVPAGSSNLDIHRIATLSVPALPSPDEWCSQGPRAALTWMCAFYGTVMAARSSTFDFPRKFERSGWRCGLADQSHYWSKDLGWARTCGQPSHPPILQRQGPAHAATVRSLPFALSRRNPTGQPSVGSCAMDASSTTTLLTRRLTLSMAVAMVRRWDVG